MAVRAVLFDLDDTLLWDERSIKETFEAVCDEAHRQCGVDSQQLEDAVRKEARALYASYETFPFTQDIGINPFEGLWANFRSGEHAEFRKLEQLAPQYRKESWTRGLKALGIDNPALGEQLGELFHKERRQRPLVYDDTFQILDTLQDKYKLLLLTNGSPDLQQEKLDGVPGLAAYFDYIIVSGNFAHGKPDSAIFQHSLKLLEVKPVEAIMVGDKLTTDIKGANGVGIASVWLNRHGIERTDDIVPKYEIQGLMDILNVIDSMNE